MFAPLWKLIQVACVKRTESHLLSIKQVVPELLVDLLDKDLRTPLHHACIWEYSELVEYLLIRGADTLGADRQGYSAFHFAVASGNSCILASLFSYTRAPVPIEPLIVHACAHNQTAPLPLLLAKLQTTAASFTESTTGRSLLHIASALGADSVVEFALEKGALPNSTDLKGRTPLHEAFSCREGSEFSIVSALLEAGADPNILDRQGQAVWLLGTPELILLLNLPQYESEESDIDQDDDSDNDTDQDDAEQDRDDDTDQDDADDDKEQDQVQEEDLNDTTSSSDNDSFWPGSIGMNIRVIG